MSDENDQVDADEAAVSETATGVEQFGADGMLKPEFVPTSRPAAVDDRFDETGMLRPEHVPPPKTQV